MHRNDFIDKLTQAELLALTRRVVKRLLSLDSNASPQTIFASILNMLDDEDIAKDVRSGGAGSINLNSARHSSRRESIILESHVEYSGGGTKGRITDIHAFVNNSLREAGMKGLTQPERDKYQLA